MAWTSTGKALISALQQRKSNMDQAVEEVANQGLVTILNEVHARMEGHIVSGNMNDSFDEESRVEKLGEAHYQIILANAAVSENDFPYPIVIEDRYGVGSGGVHAALPEIAKNLKEKIEGI